MSIAREPVFKGCTRVATLWGVPLIPLIATVGLAVLGATVLALVWPRAAWPLVVGPAVLALIAMRRITQRDDQRLAQWLIVLRLLALSPRALRAAAGTRSYRALGRGEHR